MMNRMLAGKEEWIVFSDSNRIMEKLEKGLFYIIDN